MSKPRLPNCAVKCRDGSPCGRRARETVQGVPICSVHLAQAQGKPIGAARFADDPEQILRHLMRDRDPAIRLRAVNAWFDYQERQRGCDVCKARIAGEDAAAEFVAALTPEERPVFERLMEDLKALRQTVRVRLHPELAPPPPATEEEFAQHRAHLVAEITRNKRPEEPPDAPVAAKRPSLLDEALWPQVGLYRRNDVVSHDLGDEHAQRILKGEVSFEEAAADVRRAQQQSHELRTGGVLL